MTKANQDAAAVDFVVLWVDGNDPAWREKRRPYADGQDSPCRYRDFDTIRYVMRSIEAHAPWVRRVFLVVDEQTPSWLNRLCPKLEVVNHRDFIPADYLPTFSSAGIQIHLHRIEALAEHFVLFDDDMLLLKPVGPETFFERGLPRDYVRLSKPKGRTTLFDALVENSNRLVSTSLTRRKWLSLGLRTQYGWPCLLSNVKTLITTPTADLRFSFWHSAQPHLKSMFARMWEVDPEALHSAARARFRSYQDLSHYAARFLALAGGRFAPATKGRYVRVDLSNDVSANERQLSALLTGRQTTACICDSDDLRDDDAVETTTRIIQEVLTRLFASPSQFEA